MKNISAPNPLLPDYISLHAKWQAKKPAVVHGSAMLTWMQFNQRCNQLAHQLISQGVLPGGRVAIVMSNSLDMMVALFGVMKAGAVAAPLNTSLSVEALKQQITSCTPQALILSADLPPARDLIDCISAKDMLCLISGAAETAPGWHDFTQFIAQGAPEAPDVTLSPEMTCNVIYSSGTTLAPKGIQHSHGRRRDWALDMAIALRYHGDSRYLVTIGLYSNIVWAGMLPTLIAGGTIVLTSKFDAAAANEAIAAHKITHLAMVPLQYQKMLDAADNMPADFSSLEAVMSAGSPLWAELKLRLCQRMTTGIIELYGLTEGLITTLSPADVADHAGSVGRPMMGSDIRIVDDQGHDVATGEAGEIWGHSRFIMDGYLDRPDLTEDTIATDSMGRVWLKTGDIGRVAAGGYLYIVGRIKDMILSGGQNIYPSDIEAVAVRHPAVADVAVIGMADAKWGESPVACVVLEAVSDASPAAIKGWINDRVGRHQRIRDLVLLANLPRNPNGKVVKADLRQIVEDEDIERY